VVLLVDGRPVLGVVLELQLRTKKRKRFTWPLYVTGLRARLECNCCVLVVTADPTVARWAAEPIELGPGGKLQPLVLGPDAVPVIADVEQARRAPELAVLSARDAIAILRVHSASAAGGTIKFQIYEDGYCQWDPGLKFLQAKGTLQVDSTVVAPKLICFGERMFGHYLALGIEGNRTSASDLVATVSLDLCLRNPDDTLL
jgi:hypothetical protein